jgi:hypothetical protein
MGNTIAAAHDPVGDYAATSPRKRREEKMTIKLRPGVHS